MDHERAKGGKKRQWRKGSPKARPRPARQAKGGCCLASDGRSSGGRTRERKIRGWSGRQAVEEEAAGC